MEAVFLKVLNMSITASWLVLAVLLLRLLFREAPRFLHVILWALVGVRLLCPFSIESPFSLIPSTETIPLDILYADSPMVQTGFHTVNTVVNPVISESLAPGAGDSVNPMQLLTFVCAILWICGTTVMLLYTVLSYLRIRRRVREAVPAQEGIWLCDHIDTPFILGVLRPKIYLPSIMNEGDKTHVIAHERAHLKRLDHWWKPLGFVLLAVHWFNPLLWLSYVLFCRDTELACDEKVVSGMDTEGKKQYSRALINCSAPRRMAAPCPLAFGEGSVKQRIRHVLHYKRPAFWVVLAAVLVGGAAAICLLTNPWQPDDQLKVFVDCRIAEYNQKGRQTENFAAVSWELLGAEHHGSRTTLYMWVCYREYSYDGDIHLETGSHIPTAITVEKENDAWRLVQYWEAADGSRHVPSIREKFPIYLWGKATDSQRYAKKQRDECDAMAREYFAASHAGVTADNMVFHYEDSPEQFPPELVLFLDGTFRFTYSYLSSYLPMGTYSLENGTLILHVDDGAGNTYVFHGDEDSFVFDAEKSSPIPSYRYSSDAKEAECPVPDGARFVPAV